MFILQLFVDGVGVGVEVALGDRPGVLVGVGVCVGDKPGVLLGVGVGSGVQEVQALNELKQYSKPVSENELYNPHNVMEASGSKVQLPFVPSQYLNVKVF